MREGDLLRPDASSEAGTSYRHGKIAKAVQLRMIHAVLAQEAFAEFTVTESCMIDSFEHDCGKKHRTGLQVGTYREAPNTTMRNPLKSMLLSLSVCPAAVSWGCSGSWRSKVQRRHHMPIISYRYHIYNE